MNVRTAAVAVLATAMAFTPPAAAGPDAEKQRLVITTQETGTTTTSPFVLAPLAAGALERDSGTMIANVPPERVVMRAGQRVSIYDGPAILKGKRGSLTIRVRSEYVEAGNGYHVGTGTWTVVRGTGRYARAIGSGRSGHVWLESGPWSSRLEGFLTLR